jgi:hypothetical protein
MTDGELLRRARSFDAGPPPVVNGWVLEEDDRCVANMEVACRGETGWAIVDGACCVDRETGGLVFEPMPSSRSEEFIARTRFPSAREAFAFLWPWKEACRSRALAEGLVRWKGR